MCQDLRAAELRATRSRSSVEQLNREIRTIRPKVGLNPALRVLVTISLGVEAGRLGWKIGTGINSKFLRLGLPANGTPAGYTFPEINFRQAGERSQIWYKVPVPEDGWVWSIFSTAYSWQRSMEYRPRVSNGLCQQQAFTPPQGFIEVSAPAEQYACRPSPYDTKEAVTDLKIAYKPENALKAEGPIEDYAGQPYDKLSYAPSDPGRSVVGDRLRMALESGSYPELNKKLDFELGTPNACDPVEPNLCNPPTTEQERERACEPSSGTGSDPAPELGTAENSPAFYDDKATFPRKTPSGGETMTALRVGVLRSTTRKPLAGWGWRHVKAKHGWDEADIAATAAALRDPLGEIDNPSGTSTLIYHGPEYRPREGLVCERIVLVAPTPLEGEPKSKEILTSYGAVKRSAP